MQFVHLVGLLVLLGDTLYVVLSYAVAYGPFGCVQRLAAQSHAIHDAL